MESASATQGRGGGFGALMSEKKEIPYPSALENPFIHQYTTPLQICQLYYLSCVIYDLKVDSFQGFTI